MLKMLKWWWKEDRAVVAIEVGLLMPLMMVLLAGVMDIGTGILINQKLVNADQMIADLLTRNDTVSAADLANAIEAGKLTLQPYNTDSYGVDIVGVQFVGGPTKPQVIWRSTTNMDPNQDVPDNAQNLGADQEGVVVVTVRYVYSPRFAEIIPGGATHVMTEVSFARGRNGLFVPKV